MIDWIAPPPPRVRQSSYFTDDVRAALRNRPGEWARIATARKASNGALVRRWPDFEFVTRVVHDEDGQVRFDIYARYTGPSELPA